MSEYCYTCKSYRESWGDEDGFCVLHGTYPQELDWCRYHKRHPRARTPHERARDAEEQLAEAWRWIEYARSLIARTGEP